MEPATPSPSAVPAEAISLSALRQNSVPVLAPSFLAASSNCCWQLARQLKQPKKDSRLRLPKCPPFICEWHSTDSRAEETGGPDARRGRHHSAPFQSTKRAAAWQTSWESFPQSLQQTPVHQGPPATAANYFHKLPSSGQLITQTFKVHYQSITSVLSTEESTLKSGGCEDKMPVLQLLYHPKGNLFVFQI